MGTSAQPHPSSSSCHFRVLVTVVPSCRGCAVVSRVMAVSKTKFTQFGASPDKFLLGKESVTNVCRCHAPLSAQHWASTFQQMSRESSPNGLELYKAGNFQETLGHLNEVYSDSFHPYAHLFFLLCRLSIVEVRTCIIFWTREPQFMQNKDSTKKLLRMQRKLST
jgi:hypothetical protein